MGTRVSKGTNWHKFQKGLETHRRRVRRKRAEKEERAKKISGLEFPEEGRAPLYQDMKRGQKHQTAGPLRHFQAQPTREVTRPTKGALKTCPGDAVQALNTGKGPQAKNVLEGGQAQKNHLGT